MAKTKISEYDSTAANNTDIDSINIAEGMAPSNVNNAIRELMAHLKDMDAGTQSLTSPSISSSLGIGTTSPTSYASNQATLVVEDSSNPAIALSDTGQTRDWFLVALGDGLGVRYADGGGSGSASNVTESAFFKNDGNVGIGTSSPSSLLHVRDSSATTVKIFDSSASAVGPILMLGTEDNARNANDKIGRIQFYSTDASSPGASVRCEIEAIAEDAFNRNALIFKTGNAGASASEAMRIDSSGNVGIGTTSPVSNIDVRDGTGSIVTLGNTGSFAGGESSYLKFRESSTQLAEIGWEANSNEFRVNNRIAGPMSFYTSNTERMRIDSSGNLLLGTTTLFPGQGNTSTGGMVQSSGTGYFSRDSGYPLGVNRNTNDGTLVNFAKDGSTVGQIGVNTGLVYFGQGDTNLMVSDAGNQLLPRGTNGGNRDNAIDLGSSSNRFDDIFATNATIQTSDQNEKQQIASLTDAEMTAAKAISKLFKTFKWNDKVEEKGDAARTHTGVIAQQVETAMSDAGLDAGNYAFFISTTWWEAQTEVAAVEADEENGIEAQEAYTRTDTYDTQEEAPEGATERNRKGIRYPELLSFIGAATEQRLTSIEARLDALEG